MSKTLIIFDLDDTLAESKTSIDARMATFLSIILCKVKVAIISRGNWQQFENQLFVNLAQNDGLKNLLLLPMCGTKFYQYQTGNYFIRKILAKMKKIKSLMPSQIRQI